MNLLCRDKNHYLRTVTVLFMHYSSTIYAFKNIKSGFYGTIHIFKNYFATVFSVSAIISSIQTNPKEL